MLNNLFEKNCKVDLTKHILLLLFTFGIYHFIWIYKITEYTNRIQTEQAKASQPRDTTVTLLLCIFVPFYTIFWYVKTAEILEDSIPIQTENFKLMVMITSIFIAVVAAVIVQDAINKSNETIEPDITYATVSQNSAKAPQKIPNNEFTTIELLKQLKELLDVGAITQEEFDAKKKELL